MNNNDTLKKVIKSEIFSEIFKEIFRFGKLLKENEIYFDCVNEIGTEKDIELEIEKFQKEFYEIYETNKNKFLLLEWYEGNKFIRNYIKKCERLRNEKQKEKESWKGKYEKNRNYGILSENKKGVSWKWSDWEFHSENNRNIILTKENNGINRYISLTKKEYLSQI